jgi:hypothetical protein|tara:strand:+ start:206 stop:457 length:252 start_codon:yes stop_codon:yes gene_type:complete
MKQKLVTLDSEAFNIASRMGNFSAFVRRATKATEEGGLELVEPSQMPASQMLAILLARNQKENGFNHSVNDVLISLMSHFKDL